MKNSLTLALKKKPFEQIFAVKVSAIDSLVAKSLQKQRGFTLIELLFTIAVAAILMTVALPAMSNFIKDNRLTAQANEFIQGVRVARAEATKRRNNIDLKPKAADWLNGWEVQDNVAGGGVLKEKDIQSGITSVSATSNILTFTGTGVRTVTTDFVMKYCDSRNKGRRIAIKGLIGISEVCWIGYPGRSENCTSDNSC